MRNRKMVWSVLAAALLACGSHSQAATINVLTQDFETGAPNNFSATFGFGSANDRYFNVSNAPGIILNTALTGNATAYLATQNVNEAPFPPYSDTAPALLTFNPVSVAGLTNLKLAFSAAGRPGAETVNYLRGALDQDNDGTYETQLFKFVGTADNTPYTDTALGALTEPFKNFSVSIPTPASGILKFRIESFNDTDGGGEATGIDNFVATGDQVPEPASLGLLGLASLSLLARRRR